MTIEGKSIIAGEALHGDAGAFRSYNPATGAALEPEFTQVSAEVVDAAALAAQEGLRPTEWCNSRILSVAAST